MEMGKNGANTQGITRSNLELTLVSFPIFREKKGGELKLNHYVTKVAMILCLKIAIN